MRILKINGKVWMVDDVPHWWGTLYHAQAFRGDVLCAGLGLGLIVHALDANPAVKSITVIERERSVIGLIGPLLPSRKLEIIQADWTEFSTETDRSFDGVFYDLFVGNAWQMTAQAIQVMQDLRRGWPLAVHRVFGFNNEMLIELCEAFERAQLEWADKLAQNPELAKRWKEGERIFRRESRRRAKRD